MAASTCQNLIVPESLSVKSAVYHYAILLLILVRIQRLACKAMSSGSQQPAANNAQEDRHVIRSALQVQQHP
ncbi:hypothetical protein TNCV_4943891 [Trichonephila clavipes]|nr:hypothetical protein TNCV_4943891 [Trichonephila clavipes]